MKDMFSIIYNDAAKIISTWKNGDIYAISFYICDSYDNPGTPTLTIGYNTMEQALKARNFGASSLSEAKWNYAFWLQNQEYLFGYDNETTQLIKDWILSSKFPSDENTITKEFVNILVDVSLKLHADGVIASVFGQETPIIIHELEYYDEIALQNRKANPGDVINEFLQWMDDEVFLKG